MSAEKADTDPLTQAPPLDAAPERVNSADRLMAWHARIGEPWSPAFDRERIGVANTQASMRTRTCRGGGSAIGSSTTCSLPGAIAWIALYVALMSDYLS